MGGAGRQRCITTADFDDAAFAHQQVRALHQANAPLLVMDADPDEGFIRGKMKGGPLPRGRGLLMAEDTGVFVQVAATEVRK